MNRTEEPIEQSLPALNKREVRVAGAMGAAVALSAMWVMTAFVSDARFLPAVLGDLLVRAAPGISQLSSSKPSTTGPCAFSWD